MSAPAFCTRRWTWQTPTRERATSCLRNASSLLSTETTLRASSPSLLVFPSRIVSQASYASNSDFIWVWLIPSSSNACAGMGWDDWCRNLVKNPCCIFCMLRPFCIRSPIIFSMLHMEKNPVPIHSNGFRYFNSGAEKMRWPSVIVKLAQEMRLHETITLILLIPASRRKWRATH